MVVVARELIHDINLFSGGGLSLHTISFGTISFWCYSCLCWYVACYSVYNTYIATRIYYLFGT